MKASKIFFSSALAAAYLGWNASPASSAALPDDCPWVCTAGSVTTDADGSVTGAETTWTSNGGATDGTLDPEDFISCQTNTCTNCEKKYTVTITVDAGQSIPYSATVDGGSAGSGTINTGNQPTEVRLTIQLSAKCGNQSTGTVVVGGLTESKTLPCSCD